MINHRVIIESKIFSVQPLLPVFVKLRSPGGDIRRSGGVKPQPTVWSWRRWAARDCAKRLVYIR